MAKDNDQTHDSSPPSPPEFHPALSVSNIKNCIPLILDRHSAKYSNWEELFEVHAHAYNVLDHINSKTPRPTGVSDPLWQRLDSIVKQWIYSTISSYLLDTVLAKGDTAQQVWDKIKAIFQDNKANWALYLEKQFTNELPSLRSTC
ncbi:uncharacterized protein LOC110702358 [Chenopodium quinoa]|uniref:uncharacterized protein LOC110702358 n=1 Tax=Chenopodium quinoa TaxID=63459 RepID=UPI000B76BFE5|nr:uncharacterized protein LOC110702358 [Chenopodium quinoa]